MKTFEGDRCLDYGSCLIERFCSVRVIDYKYDNQYAIFTESLKFVAAVCSFSVGFLILRDERISVHPGKLLALIALS
jgi:hypothetical protein